MTHKPTTDFRWHAGIPTVLLLCVMFAGCSTIPEKRLEKEQLTLVYRHKSTAGSEIEKLRMQHPIEITREAVQNHLLSLRYEELSLTGKRKFVFAPDDVLAITPLITKALNRLSPDNILYYEVDTVRGTTAGSVFGAGEKIHWRLDSIKGSNFSNSSFPGWRGSTWRLVPKDGQRYGRSNNLFGKSIQENWIAANFTLPSKSKRNLHARPTSKRSTARMPKRSQPELSPGDQEALEKRLQFLKDLRDKNLIDDREYERKRKELLDQYL